MGRCLQLYIALMDQPLDLFMASQYNEGTRPRWGPSGQLLLCWGSVCVGRDLKASSCVSVVLVPRLVWRGARWQWASSSCVTLFGEALVLVAHRHVGYQGTGLLGIEAFWASGAGLVSMGEVSMDRGEDSRSAGLRVLLGVVRGFVGPSLSGSCGFGSLCRARRGLVCWDSGGVVEGFGGLALPVHG